MRAKGNVLAVLVVHMQYTHKSMSSFHCLRLPRYGLLPRRQTQKISIKMWMNKRNEWITLDVQMIPLAVVVAVALALFTFV